LCRFEWEAICSKLIQLLNFSFLLSVRSPFVWFSSGTSKFDFGPNFLREFCKENESFDNLEWNKRLLYVSSMLIIDLGFLLLSLNLFMHLLYLVNYINIDFFSNLSIIKKIILSTCNQYLWIRKQFLMAINIGSYSRIYFFRQVRYENAWVRSFHIFSSNLKKCWSDLEDRAQY